MIPADRTEASERVARIERMIDEYRNMKRREHVRRAMKLWRNAEDRRQLAAFELPPERLH